MFLRLKKNRNVLENVTFVVFILFHYFGKNTIQSRWLIPIKFFCIVIVGGYLKTKVFLKYTTIYIFQGLKTYFNAKLNFTRYVSLSRCLLKFVLEASGSCYNKTWSCVYQIEIITIMCFMAVAQFSLFMRSIKFAKFHSFISFHFHFVFISNAKVNVRRDIPWNLIFIFSKCYDFIYIYI